MASSKLMMNMSSSTTRNSDLIRRKSSNSSSSSTSTNHNHNHKRTSPASTINNNSGNFQMTLDSLSPTLHNNNHQQQPPPLENTLLDAQINLLDAGTAINNSVAPLCRQESERASSKIAEDVWKEIVAGGRSCKQEVADEMMTLEDFLAKAGAVEEEDVKMVPRLPSGGGSGMFSYDPPKVNVDGFGMGVEEMGVGGRGKRRAMLETLDKAAQQRQRRMIKNRESAARSRERKQAYQAELESLAVKLEEENEMLLKVKTEQTRKRYKQLMENIIPVTEKHRPRRYALTRARSMEW